MPYQNVEQGIAAIQADARRAEARSVTLAARAQGAMVQCGILFLWTAAYALLVAAIPARVPTLTARLGPRLTPRAE